MQSAFVPDSAAVSRAGLTVPPNLDSFAYERRAAAPSTAYAQAQVPQAQPPPAPPVRHQPQQAQPQVQTRTQPDAAMQAHAQAVVPVVPVVAQPVPEPAYGLDTGDKLRIVVLGQEV